MWIRMKKGYKIYVFHPIIQHQQNWGNDYNQIHGYKEEIHGVIEKYRSEQETGMGSIIGTQELGQKGLPLE